MTTTVQETPAAEVKPAIVEPPFASGIAASLRDLADMVEANPGIFASKWDAAYGLVRLLVTPVQTREQVAALARAGLHAGAKVTKHVGDKWAGVDITFPSGTGLHVYADREEVCERVVTGTREVTETVPDPEALAAVPLVEVTKTVEDVEWRCGSFLAPTAETSVGAA